MRARPHLFATLAAAAAALAATAACSLTTSLSGLSNGPDDDAATDGATSGDRTAPLVPESGTADAADSGDASTPAQPFRCSDHATALFCADFDEGVVTAGWSSTLVANGGTVTLGDGLFGHGVAGSVPTRASTTQSTRPSAALEASVSLMARQPMTYAFDMRMEGTVAGAGVVDFGGVDFHNPYYVIGFRSDDSGAIHLHEYGDAIGSSPLVLDDLLLTQQPAVGRWIHIRMQLTFPTSTTARLAVRLDDALVYDGPIHASPYASTPFVLAGIDVAEAGGQARTIDFDDVLVTSP